MRKGKEIIFFVGLLVMLAFVGCTTSGTQDLSGEMGSSTPIPTQPSGNVSTPNVNNPTPTPNTEEILKNIVMPSSEEIFFELLCDNIDITVYKGNGGWNFIFFKLLSTRDLSGEEILVSTDIQTTPVSVGNIINSGDSRVFDLETFYTYQGISWEKVLAKQNIEEQTRIKQAYELVKESLPTVYMYQIQIPYSALGIDDVQGNAKKVNEITISIGGVQKSYEIDNISREPEMVGGFGSALMQIQGYAWGYRVRPTLTGEVVFPEVSFIAKSDLTLESIKIENREVAVVQCNLVLRLKNGFVITTVWDGKSSFDVDEGTEIAMILTVEDSYLANKLQGITSMYISVEYECNGQMYFTTDAALVLLTAESSDIYAHIVDDIDPLPYYMEYLNCLKD
ncbi:MAG: hypothetical protein IKV30_01235 [Clostridia bacterium]|nr:hypothetical protein [Clostridia bacterium]